MLRGAPETSQLEGAEASVIWAQRAPPHVRSLGGQGGVGNQEPSFQGHEQRHSAAAAATALLPRSPCDCRRPTAGQSARAALPGPPLCPEQPGHHKALGPGHLQGGVTRMQESALGRPRCTASACAMQGQSRASKSVGARAVRVHKHCRRARGSAVRVHKHCSRARGRPGALQDAQLGHIPPCRAWRV